MSEEIIASPRRVEIRREIEEQAGDLIGRLAYEIREGGAPMGRFTVSLKPLFDEIWDLAKFVAENEG